MDRQGRQSSRERDAGELQAQGPGGAAADRARLLARTDRAVRLRAADPALAGEGDRDALAQREMEDPPRRPLPRARRQPGRLSPAARLAPLCSAGVLSLCRRRRSDRAARAAAGTRGAERARPAGRFLRRGRADATGPGTHRAEARRHRRRGPHRADGRGARRAPVRVHAAGAEARGLSRARRGGGSGGRDDRTAGPDRGLRPAGRSAPQRDPRRAGPGRHRGEHPSRFELARMRGDDRGDLRRGAAGAARRRQVHDRRQALGNRRRQSCRGRRGDAARQSRSSGVPIC